MQGTKEKLYDLKVGSWQNRVDQDLEVTRRQIEKMDTNQKEINQELKVIADTLAILAMEKEEKGEIRKLPGPPFPEQRALGGGINALRFGESRTSERANEVKPIRKPRVTPTTYLPGGSMARSILLTGVDAPVGGKPFPVLIALTEAFNAPNSYR
ncbi:MAG: hypothetical protein ACE5FB_01590, partial [Candidatus Binatia bacterium]